MGVIRVYGNSKIWVGEELGVKVNAGKNFFIFICFKVDPVV